MGFVAFGGGEHGEGDAGAAGGAFVDCVDGGIGEGGEDGEGYAVFGRAAWVEELMVRSVKNLRGGREGMQAGRQGGRQEDLCFGENFTASS